MDGENFLSQENYSQENSFFKSFLSLRNLAILSIILTVINLGFLGFLTTKDPKSAIVEKVINITKPSEPSSQVNSTNLADQICPRSCVSQIYEATSSYKLSIPSITPISTPTPEVSLASSYVKEFFIPFGSGSSSAGDWEDIAGVQITFDTNNFPELKSVTFEATVRIPTGNEVAYIRLYNVTDKHPIWASETSWEGGGTKLLTKTITLDAGNKTYQIQMKTSLKYQAIFDQARLHIITN